MELNLFQCCGNRFLTASASLAVVLIVPPHVDTCCQAKQPISSSPKSCCHARQNPAPRPKSEPSATHTACGGSHVACKCICCWTVNDQTLPPTRPAIGGQPDFMLAFGSYLTARPADDAGAAIISGSTAALGAVAIPHRILHCSWLI